MPQPYEFFDHTADIGARVFGRTLEELFTNAAGTGIFIAGMNFHGDKTCVHWLDWQPASKSNRTITGAIDPNEFDTESSSTT